MTGRLSTIQPDNKQNAKDSPERICSGEFLEITKKFLTEMRTHRPVLHAEACLIPEYAEKGEHHGNGKIKKSYL